MEPDRIWCFIAGSLVVFGIVVTSLLVRDFEKCKQQNLPQPTVEMTTNNFFGIPVKEKYTVSIVTETRVVNGRHETTTKTIFQKQN